MSNVSDGIQFLLFSFFFATGIAVIGVAVAFVITIVSHVINGGLAARDRGE